MQESDRFLEMAIQHCKTYSQQAEAAQDRIRICDAYWPSSTVSKEEGEDKNYTKVFIFGSWLEFYGISYFQIIGKEWPISSASLVQNRNSRLQDSHVTPFILMLLLWAADRQGYTPQQDTTVYLSCSLPLQQSRCHFPSARRKSYHPAELCKFSKATQRADSSSSTRNQGSWAFSHKPLRPQPTDTAKWPLWWAAIKSVKRKMTSAAKTGLPMRILGFGLCSSPWTSFRDVIFISITRYYSEDFRPSSSTLLPSARHSRWQYLTEMLVFFLIYS